MSTEKTPPVEALDHLLTQLEKRGRARQSTLIVAMQEQAKKAQKEQQELRASQLSGVPSSFEPKIEHDEETGIITATDGDHVIRIHNANKLSDEVLDDLRIALYAKIQRHNVRKSA